ncbi:hypothetical protein ATO6_08645 [Oceanicola sp. 22II-s10i]|uniref:HvfC/BufC N-terminal domain-containing protein n=1 Tax=Oceanicola sp. 22II-s10i TaxID=1317116 RepID=UPI000B523D30|nr:DNA-binding domain-containing protein [Oceanicola sp. 22II-s10i]OWU85103.1 hypothetical protein ATO6_08645 [Oceanicola sp. 22II-s10i]
MSVTQTEFRRSVLDPEAPAPGGLSDGRGGAADRRFAVYRNNVTVSLTDAMESAFPTVAKLIGPESFRSLARLALRAHPPRSPLMMEFGADFPAFLEGFEPLAHLGYLPDVARLDHAMRLSYHAADADPLPAAVQSMPPDQLATARLQLAPACRILRSRWPLHGIWRFNHEDGAPQPQARPEDVLIARPGYDPAPHLLPPGGAAFLTAAASAPLGNAYEAALTETPDFDLTALLSLLIGTGAITALE